MKSQKRDREEDSSDGPGHHAKDIETIGEVMQRAEARKKFLRKIIKTVPSHFTTLRYCTSVCLSVPRYLEIDF